MQWNSYRIFLHGVSTLSIRAFSMLIIVAGLIILTSLSCLFLSLQNVIFAFGMSSNFFLIFGHSISGAALHMPLVMWLWGVRLQSFLSLCLFTVLLSVFLWVFFFFYPAPPSSPVGSVWLEWNGVGYFPFLTQKTRTNWSWVFPFSHIS